MKLGFGAVVRCGLFSAAVVAGAGACGGSFSLASAGSDGGANEGGADAGDGGATAFCASAGAQAHFFCDDFDPPLHKDPSDVKGPWDGELSQGSASITIDSASAKSAPNDLLVALTKTGTTDQDQAALGKQVGKARDLTIAYDALVDAYGTTQGQTATSVALVTVFQITSNINMALGLIDPSTAYFYETTGTGSTVSHKLSTGIPTGRWVHVSLRIQPPSLSLQNGNVHIEIDNAVVLDEKLNVAQNIVNVGSSVDLGMLFPPNGSAAALWSLHFDNVTIDRALLP